MTQQQPAQPGTQPSTDAPDVTTVQPAADQPVVVNPPEQRSGEGDDSEPGAAGRRK